MAPRVYWHAVFQASNGCSTVDENPYVAPDRNEITDQQPPAEATQAPIHNLTPAHLFEVGVRVLGLFLITSGASQLIAALAPSEQYTAFDYVLSAVLDLTFGTAYFLFAKALVAIVYGGRDRFSSD